MTLPSTIIYPEAFVRSPSAGFDGAMNWEWVTSAINRRRIAPTDGDAIVNINHFFLMFETKDVGVEINRNSGQERTLRELVHTGLWTVIHQWGKARPDSWCVETLHKISQITSESASCPIQETAIFKFVRSWADWADRQPRDAWCARMQEAAAMAHFNYRSDNGRGYR